MQHFHPHTNKCCEHFAAKLIQSFWNILWIFVTSSSLYIRNKTKSYCVWNVAHVPLARDHMLEKMKLWNKYHDLVGSRRGRRNMFKKTKRNEMTKSSLIKALNMSYEWSTSKSFMENSSHNFPQIFFTIFSIFFQIPTSWKSIVFYFPKYLCIIIWPQF